MKSLALTGGLLASLLLSACGSVAKKSALQSDDPVYDRVKTLTFEEVCEALGQNPADFPASYKNTLEILRAKAGVSACSDLYKAFVGRELDLSHQSELALALIVKLQGVAALDLSHNNLTDIQQLRLRPESPSDPKIVHGLWDSSLKKLDLSFNQITDPSVVAFFSELNYLDLSHNALQNFEGVQALGSGEALSKARLQVLNLADNPLQFPELDGKKIEDTATYGFLKNDAVVYLDVSRTRLQTLSFLKPMRFLSYLSADGLTLKDKDLPPMGLFELSFVSVRDTTGMSPQLLYYADKLYALDLSGNTVSSLQGLSVQKGTDGTDKVRPKKDLALLLVSGTGLDDYARINSDFPGLRYVSAFHTGMTQGLALSALKLADYQKTQVSSAPAIDGQTLLDVCADAERCLTLASEPEDRSGLLSRAFFCKKDLDTQGTCADDQPVLNPSELRFEYQGNDAKAPLTKVCGPLAVGKSLDLPLLGSFTPETRADGTQELCARFAASEKVFF